MHCKKQCCRNFTDSCEWLRVNLEKTMINIGQIERLTQNRIVKLFREKLGYDYLGNWEERPNNSNIEELLLRKYLVKVGYSEELNRRAIY